MDQNFGLKKVAKNFLPFVRTNEEKDNLTIHDRRIYFV